MKQTPTNPTVRQAELMPTPRTARRSPEAELQARIVAYVDGMGLPLTSSKNGAYSSARVGAHYKRLGVKAGFPDIFIAKVGARGEPGLFVEVKAPGKRLRPNQLAWQRMLRSEGYVSEMVTSVDAFKRILKVYLTGEGPQFERTVVV